MYSVDRMAIFVEGQTEQRFAQQLVNEVAGRHRVHIDLVKGYGGSSNSRVFSEVLASRPDPKKEFYVLIYDSAGVSRVLPDVVDQYAGLVSQKYRDILALQRRFSPVSFRYPDYQVRLCTFCSEFAFFSTTCFGCHGNRSLVPRRTHPLFQTPRIPNSFGGKHRTRLRSVCTRRPDDSAPI